MRARSPVWDGIYASRRDVPAVRDEYDAELIDEMVSTTTAAWREVGAGRKPVLWHEALSLLAGAMSDRGALRVIDFGGGVGSGFVQLLSSLPGDVALDYVIVESAAMCQAGRSIFGADTRIGFETRLPAVSEALDIVYLNAVLPYIDDYRAVLQQIAGLAPRHVLFARLAAGDVPTFASRQLNLPGRVFPYWFLNLGEVIQIMTGAGYRLASDGHGEHHYDVSNFPETHRVGRLRTVLFARR
jgi:putative methyltransferase (TIGR04325 family)